MAKLFLLLLKVYSGVSLIHGLTHSETVLDSLPRDKVCRPLANLVLASSDMGPNIKLPAVLYLDYVS